MDWVQWMDGADFHISKVGFCKQLWGNFIGQSNFGKSELQKTVITVCKQLLVPVAPRASELLEI